MIKKKSFGLALGGGGARGIAHIGAVRELLKAGLRPDYISGSSMGALVGSLLALGRDWDEVETMVLGLDKKTAAKTLIDIGKVNQSVLKGEKVKRFIEGLLGETLFEETKIPFSVVATDIIAGEEVILKEGLIREAVMASIAVPGIFPPVRLGERLFIDGGVTNPTPIDVVRAMGAEVVLGIDLISKEKQVVDNTPSLVNTLLLAFETIRKQAMEYKLRGHDSDLIIIKPEKRSLLDSFRFYDIHDFLLSGEESILEILPELQKKLGLAK